MQRFAWIGALMVAALSAHAQSNEKPSFIPVNMNLRIGGAYVLDDATRNSTNTMFALGADFNTNLQLVHGRPAFLSVDVYRSSLGGQHNTFIPVMYNQRFELGMDPNSGRQTYFFVGAGVTMVDVTSSKWVVGLRGGVGTTLSTNTFAEATLLVSSDARGAKANSIGLFFGYKF